MTKYYVTLYKRYDYEVEATNEKRALIKAISEHSFLASGKDYDDFYITEDKIDSIATIDKKKGYSKND